MKQLTPLNLSLLQLRVIGLVFVAIFIASLLLIEFLPVKWRAMRTYIYSFAFVIGCMVAYLLVVFQSTVK